MQSLVVIVCLCLEETAEKASSGGRKPEANHLTVFVQ